MVNIYITARISWLLLAMASLYLDSGGPVNSSSSTASSTSADKSLDRISPDKDVAAAAKSGMDMRSDIERLQRIFLVSVSGNVFYVWRLVEATYKKTLVLPPGNQNPKVKKPKQQPKFRNAEEPDASYRLDAIFLQVPNIHHFQVASL